MKNNCILNIQRGVKSYSGSKFALAAAMLLASSAIASASGHWTPLKNQPTFLNPPSQCAAYPGTANCAPPGSFSFGGVQQALLMTDGSLLFVNLATDDNFVSTMQVNKLTPDAYGSYVNGTWTNLANLPKGYNPFVIGSAVLADGRVVIIGGEYDFVNCPTPPGIIGACISDLNQSAIYDPVTNSWALIAPPSFFPSETTPFAALEWLAGLVGLTYIKPIADPQTVVLPNGKLMIASKIGRLQAILDPKTLTWTATGAGKADINAEEGWTLLPNGKVLTVDAYAESKEGFVPYTSYPTFPNNTHSEIYDPATGTWQSAGSTIMPLTNFDLNTALDIEQQVNQEFAAGKKMGDPNDPTDVMNYLTLAVFYEIGPQVLLPNGKVVVFGATGNNAIYDSKLGTWSVTSPSPTVNINGQPTQLVNGDTGASVLPNGNILVQLCAGVETTPCFMYEFDGKHFSLTDNFPDAASASSVANTTVLPSGQVIESDVNTDVEIYTPDDKSYNPSWAPVITKAPKAVSPGKQYKIEGIRFNGMTQASFEGDDEQTATNYPLVRITNLKTGHVFYSRTHDHSSMGVAVKGPVFTYFDVPNNQELGTSKLEVVTNGIPSKAKIIEVNAQYDQKN